MIIKKIFLFAALVAATTFTACKDDDGGYPRTVEITYKVTGSVPQCNVIYANETGGNDNVSNSPLPFSKTFKRTVNKLDAATLGATASVGGNIKLEILLDGKVVETKSASGTDVISESVVYLFQ